jgi:hypothetical protein
MGYSLNVVVTLAAMHRMWAMVSLLPSPSQPLLPSVRDHPAFQSTEPSHRDASLSRLLSSSIADTQRLARLLSLSPDRGVSVSSSHSADTPFVTSIAITTPPRTTNAHNHVAHARSSLPLETEASWGACQPNREPFEVQRLSSHAWRQQELTGLHQPSLDQVLLTKAQTPLTSS